MTALSHETILKRFDTDNAACQEMQKEYRDDTVFIRVDQWADDYLNDVATLEYRGTFDLLKSSIRKLMAEMLSNPVQARFRAKSNTSEDQADQMQGIYRTDLRDNRSMNAVKIALRNQLEGGYGAWRFITEYEDDSIDNNNQVIKRVPIHDAATCCVWDANAQTMDKSDANHVTILTPFSKDGWKSYAEENGYPEQISSLDPKVNVFQFQWIEKDLVYIGEHYVKEKKKDKVLYYISPVGEQQAYYKSDLNAEIMDALDVGGFQKMPQEKKVTRTVINKYIVSGLQVLEGPIRVAGKHLPVVPCYGEWSIFEGKEIYEGVVRIAKDGQRLRNAILSYNADKMLKSPRKKPFFFQEQIQGYEHMYESDNNYPYYLVNRVNMNGEDLPAGPMNYMEDPEFANADAYMLEQASAAVRESTTSGVDAGMATNMRMAEGSINALNSRADLETYIFQDNMATAMRRDGEIYMSMAAEVHDIEKEMTMTGPDGKEKKVVINQQVMDWEQGKPRIVNQITDNFEVFTDVGPSFQTQKDQYRAQLSELLSGMVQGTPEYQVVLFTLLSMMEGPATDIPRKFASDQLLNMGLREPETEDEMKKIQQMREQASQPDPVTESAVLANQASASKDMAMQKKYETDAIRSIAETDKAQAQTVEILAKAEQTRLQNGATLNDIISMLQVLQQDNTKFANNANMTDNSAVNQIPQTM